MNCSNDNNKSVHKSGIDDRLCRERCSCSKSEYYYWHPDLGKRLNARKHPPSCIKSLPVSPFTSFTLLFSFVSTSRPLFCSRTSTPRPSLVVSTIIISVEITHSSHPPNLFPSLSPVIIHIPCILLISPIYNNQESQASSSLLHLPSLDQSRVAACRTRRGLLSEPQHEFKTLSSLVLPFCLRHTSRRRPIKDKQSLSPCIVRPEGRPWPWTTPGLGQSVSLTLHTPSAHTASTSRVSKTAVLAACYFLCIFSLNYFFLFSPTNVSFVKPARTSSLPHRCHAL
jgi:hypothetical protein